MCANLKKMVTIANESAMSCVCADKLLSGEYVQLCEKVGIAVPSRTSAAGVSLASQPIHAAPSMILAPNTEVQGIMERYREIRPRLETTLPGGLLLDVHQTVTDLANLARASI